MERILYYIFIFAQIMRSAQKIPLFLVVPCMVFLCVFYTACIKETARLPVTVPKSFCDSLDVKYSADIIDIMQLNCAISGCHDGSGGAPLDLNIYADLKTYVDNGMLQSRVIDLKDMPPSGPLPDSLIQKLKCWVDAGAPNN